MLQRFAKGFVWVLLGCAPALDIPDSGKISCKSAADCPPDWVCNPAGQCVVADSLDATPPEIGTFLPGPARKAGTTALFSFTLSEPVASLGVKLDATDVGSPTCTVGSDLLAACSYSVGGSENGGLGGVVAVQAEAVDAAGNQANRRTVGTLVLDFSAPALAMASVGPAFAKLGDTLQVFITASEPLAESPLVTLAPALQTSSGPVSSLALIQEPGTLNYTGAITIDVPINVEVAFTTTLTDVAGNVSGVLAISSVQVDSQAPLLQSAALNPTVAKDGTTVTLQATLDAALVQSPSARIGDIPMTLVSSNGAGVYGFSLVMQSSVFTDGSYPATLEAEDSAGNRFFSTVGLVSVDTAAPNIVTQVSPTNVRLGDSIQIALTANEPLTQAPLVSLSRSIQTAAGATTQLALTQQGTTLSYVGSLTPEPGSDGPVGFTTDVEDVAGNISSGLDLGSVNVDTQTPSMVDATLSATLVRDGDVVVATFELDELVADLPTVRMGDTLLLSTGALLPPEYEFELTVGALPDDTYAVSMEANDDAGNRLFATVGSVRVDTTPPELLVGSLSLQIVPAPGLPPSVSALGGGASALLTFITSEPVTSAASALSPALPHTTPDEVATFAALSGSNVVFSFDVDFVDGSFSDGDFGVEVAVADLAGNQATLDLGQLAVDRAEPDPIDTSAWRHVRIPWGDARTGGLAQHFLGSSDAWDAPTLPSIGAAAVCPPDCLDDSGVPAEVVALRAYNAGGARLAQIPRTASGFAWTSMANADASRIYVAAVDQAGNESPTRTQVDHVDWLATLSGKVAANTAINPHVFESWKQESRAYQVNSFAAYSDTPATPALGGVMADTRATPWLLRTALTTPALGSSNSARFVYDNFRDRLLMVQRSGADAAGTVWAFDGQRWTSIAPTDPEGDGNPQFRDFAVYSFDTRRSVLTMFGGNPSVSGCDGRPTCDTVWEWNGQSWRAHVPSGSWPISQQGAGMVYDSARRVTVLFGGTVFDAGVWEWDGAAWTLLCTSPPCNSAMPTWRHSHAMAFDATRGVTVVHGGTALTSNVECSVLGSGCNTTWEWDGTVWQQMCTSAPCNATTPGYRSSSAAVFAEAPTARVLLFGGLSTAGSYRNETWSWNGTAWTQECTGGGCVPPTGRNGAAAAYWPGTGMMVGFGTSTSCAGSICSDVQAYQGTAWLSAWPRTSPTQTYNNVALAATSTFAYQHGGSVSGQTCSNSFDMPPLCSASGSGPSRCAMGTSLYMPGVPEMCLCQDGSMPTGTPPNYVCVKRDLYRFANNTWQSTCTTPPCSTNAPTPRDEHGLAADESGNLVAFGGNTSPPSDAATYVHNGTVWTKYSVSSPVARRAHAMARAPGGGALLFGGTAFSPNCDGSGSQLCNGTWLWRSNTWTRCASGDPVCNLTDPSGDGSPAGRIESAMAYDPLHNYTYLFGGRIQMGSVGLSCPDGSVTGPTLNCYLNDLWRFDGSDWVRLDTALAVGAPRPTGRALHTVYYDTVRQALVVIGGGGDVNACEGNPGCTPLNFPCSCRTDQEWLWDGAGWTENVFDDPTGGGRPQRPVMPQTKVAYVAGMDSALFFNSGQYFKLYPGAEQAAQVARFSLASVTPDAAALDDITVTWATGATGDGGGCSAQDGATLELWDGAWIPLASSNASAALPSEVVWSVSVDPILQGLASDVLLERLAFGAEDYLVLRAVPDAAPGCVQLESSLVTNTLSVRVAYH